MSALRWLVAVALLCCATSAVASAPQLGDYGLRSAFFIDVDPDSVRAARGADGNLGPSQSQYERGRRLHRTSLVVGGLGALAFLPTGTVFISSVFAGNRSVAAVSGVGLLVSVVVGTGGLIAANVGAANADAAVARAFRYSPKPGAAIAGVLVFFTGIALVPFTSGASAIFGVAGGFALSAIQIARPNRHLRNLGFLASVAPVRGGGLVLVGTRF